MYGYGYRYNSGLVIGAGGGAPFVNTKSLQFDGVDDYVTMDSASSIFSSAYSVSFWFNGDSFPSGGPGGRVLFSLHDASGGNLLLLYANTSGTLITYNNIAIRTTGTTTTNTGTWNNCIITSDGTNMKLYKNGTLEDTNSVGNFTTGTVGRVTLGQEWDGASPSDFYNGKLDEVSFFNSVLSQSEVTSIYNGGTPNDLSLLATPPLNWYRNGDNGAWKSPQWLIPNNENKDKVSNYSFEFDGVDDSVNCGNISALDNVTSATWSIWSNSSITSSYHYLMSCYSAGFKQYLFKQSTNKIDIFLSDSSGTLRLMNTSNFTFTAGVWFHIAMVYDETEVSDADKLKVYIDGVLQTNTVSGFALTSLYVSKGNPTEIGKAGGFTSNQYNGNIDEVAIFDSAVSIGDLWDGSGEPTTISGAIAHYKMGEEATFSGGVWTVPDAAGSNNGTSNGMTIEDRIGEAPNSTSNAVSFNMDEVDRTTDVPT